MPKINVKKPINFCNEDIYCYLHQKCNGYNKKTQCKNLEENSSCNDVKKSYSDARIVFYTLGLGCVLSGQKNLQLTCCERNNKNSVITCGTHDGTHDSTHETFDKYIHNIRQLITVFI